MSFTSARRDLALVIAAKAMSLLGDEIAAVALVLRLQERGAGPRAVAALLIAGMLPLLVLAGPVGRLVDRYDSRTLLLSSSLIQATVCTVLARTTGTEPILALVAALGAGQAVNGATWQALLPTIAGADGLPRALGLSQVGTTMASVAAPAIGGTLTGLYGARVPLLVDAVSFLAITVAGLLVATRRTAVPGSTDVRPRGGVQIVWGDRLLRLLIGLLGMFVLLGAMVNVVEVFLVRQTLHASATVYGVVGAAFGVGAVIGAVLAGRRSGDRSLAAMFVLAALTLAAALAAVGAAPTIGWLLPAAVVAGAGNGALNVTLSALVMGRALPTERGRVGAVLNGVASATQLGAFALAALAAVSLSPRQIFEVAGSAGMLAPALFGRRLMRAAASGSAAISLSGSAAVPLPGADQPSPASVPSQVANASKL